MNNVFVYCELEGTTVADVSLELLTKGRKLANQLNCQLEAIIAGSGLEGIEKASGINVAGKIIETIQSDFTSKT